MTLVDIVPRYAFILGKLDQGFLLLLLSVLDSRVDEDCNTIVRLLLQMSDKLRLEDTRDDGIAFFACSRVKS